MVDHLFRHQYGKMVAILAKIFGPNHLDLIEDALQDTFLKASLQWRKKQPEAPEAWFIAAARNRVLDLLRQVQSREKREASLPHSAVALEIQDFFLEHEVQDSQLRMLFLACSPNFSRSEQICFALKSISGFSQKEIAAALLEKPETIKKRISRARQKIQDQNIKLAYPSPGQIESGLQGVLQIIYLIFNEGFHSVKKDQLIDRDLCGEALRLCKLLLTKESFRSGKLYALFALLCLNSARIEAKTRGQEIIDLKNQDRSLWFQPLIKLGQDALMRSLADYDDRSAYHYEALIAYEHMRAEKFEDTDWEKVLQYYQNLEDLLPSQSLFLAKASIYLQLQDPSAARAELECIDPNKLAARQYLYHATLAEIYSLENKFDLAQKALLQAIKTCSNQLEGDFLKAKLEDINKP